MNMNILFLELEIPVTKVVQTSCALDGLWRKAREAEGDVWHLFLSVLHTMVRELFGCISADFDQIFVHIHSKLTCAGPQGVFWPDFSNLPHIVDICTLNNKKKHSEGPHEVHGISRVEK